jgi:sugar/nucleoside kinase (ribokinase family)
MLVCTLGDLLLDVVVRLDGGLVRGGDVRARTVVSAGGQAANVAAWAASLGARARLIAKRADDETGRLAASEVQALGVEVVGPTAAAGATGIVVALVDPVGERTMASDRGVSASFAVAELDQAWLAGCDHLFVSGYCLSSDGGRQLAGAAIAGARAHGAVVSLDLSATSAIDSIGAETLRALVADFRPDAVFCNEDEDRRVGGVLDDIRWILKRGALGASFDGDERAAVHAAAVDSTGAGDALAAGWIVGGPELGLETAARCVAQVGAMPRAS